MSDFFIVVESKPISNKWQVKCFYCRNPEKPPSPPPPPMFSEEDILPPENPPQDPINYDAIWTCTHAEAQDAQWYSEPCNNLDWKACPFNPENKPEEVEGATDLVQDDAERTLGREAQDAGESPASSVPKPKPKKKRKKISEEEKKDASAK